MEQLYRPPTFPLNLDPAISRSLSLQFVLEELLRSCRLLEPWETLSIPQKKAIIDKVESISFVKLHTYVDALSTASMAIDSSGLSIAFEAMEKIIRNAKHALLRSEKKIELLLPNPFFAECSRFFLALTPFFEESKSDENVLFYCLEQKDALNRFLGPFAAEKLFQRLFPSGPESLREYLEERYCRRGFNSHFAKHQALLDKLLWPLS